MLCPIFKSFTSSLSLSLLPTSSLDFVGWVKSFFSATLVPPTIKTEAVVTASICSASECSSECSGASEAKTEQKPWMTYIKQR